MFGSAIVPDDIHQRGVGNVSYSDDVRKIVRFYRKSVHLGYQSEVEGRPIFEGRDFVKIQDPGDHLTIVDREAREDDKYRWPRHWQAYQDGQEQDAAGTPLATLFPANPETVDMMRGLKITTCEQLAGMSEQGIAKLGMGGRANVLKAKNFLEAAAGMAQAHALQHEIEKRDDVIAKLEQRLAALESAADEAPRRGPGRPPKQRDED
jgi:hypothetical protein